MTGSTGPWGDGKTVLHGAVRRAEPDPVIAERVRRIKRQFSADETVVRLADQMRQAIADGTADAMDADDIDKFIEALRTHEETS